MLIVIAGPSGSGKTTFIQNLTYIRSDFKIITVEVASKTFRDYSNTLGRRRVGLKEFFTNIEKNKYYATYEYAKALYGFTLPQNIQQEVFILDYPGEYPECIELKFLNWKGLLILPVNEEVLRDRLLKANRAERIESAIQELYECYEDIKNNKFLKWDIIINESLDKLKKDALLICNKVGN